MKNRMMMMAMLGGMGTAALGDVYVEIDFANSTPNGSTDPFLEIFNPTQLSVYIWADEPGVSIQEIRMTLNGESQQGQLGSGGICRLSSLGVADPDNLFLFGLPGHHTSDTIIDFILLANSVFPATEVPVGSGSAYEFYAGFTATAETSGAGVMPYIEVDWAPGTAAQTVHTYGIYQTPTPGTFAVVGMIGVLGGGRRRGRSV